MIKGKTRISGVLKIRNYHYGLRKKPIKHGKWGIKQDLAAKKFRTQNLVATYTLTLIKNLEYFMNSSLGILYIFSKLEKLEVQKFKRYTNRSWNEEVMAIWRQLHKAEGLFRNDFEIHLMNSKSNSKWPQFRIHPLWSFLLPPSHLGNFI